MSRVGYSRIELLLDKGNRRIDMKLPAKLPPEALIIERDTREQLGYTPDELRLPVVDGTLPEGDYRLAAAPNLAVVERKGDLSDLMCVVGRERRRFETEVQRLLSYRHRLLVVESSWEEIEQGNYRGKVSPNAAIGSLLSWQSRGLPVLMAGSRKRAALYVGRWLYLVAQRHWRQLRAIAHGITDEVGSQRNCEGVS